MNIHQARKLAETSGWGVTLWDPRSDYWSMSFEKPDKAAIFVRFSPTGILTKVDATDFVTGIHRAPTRYKGDRLSHYLTEGIN